MGGARGGGGGGGSEDGLLASAARLHLLQDLCTREMVELTATGNVTRNSKSASQPVCFARAGAKSCFGVAQGAPLAVSPEGAGGGSAHQGKFRAAGLRERARERDMYNNIEPPVAELSQCAACSECFGSTFRPKPGWLECLRKHQDNIMLNNTLSQLSRGSIMTHLL